MDSIRNTVCSTCLARDRRLFEINEIWSVLQSLGVEHSEDHKVCFECKAIAKRIETFKHRATLAQGRLYNVKLSGKDELRNLSRLGTTEVSIISCVEQLDELIDCSENGVVKVVYHVKIHKNTELLTENSHMSETSHNSKHDNSFPGEMEMKVASADKNIESIPENRDMDMTDNLIKPHSNAESLLEKTDDSPVKTTANTELLPENSDMQETSPVKIHGNTESDNVKSDIIDNVNIESLPEKRVMKENGTDKINENTWPLTEESDIEDDESDKIHDNVLPLSEKSDKKENELDELQENTWPLSEKSDIDEAGPDIIHANTWPHFEESDMEKDDPNKIHVNKLPCSVNIDTKENDPHEIHENTWSDSEKNYMKEDDSDKILDNSGAHSEKTEFKEGGADKIHENTLPLLETSDMQEDDFDEIHQNTWSLPKKSDVKENGPVKIHKHSEPEDVNSSKKIDKGGVDEQTTITAKCLKEWPVDKQLITQSSKVNSKILISTDAMDDSATSGKAKQDVVKIQNQKIDSTKHLNTNEEEIHINTKIMHKPSQSTRFCDGKIMTLINKYKRKRTMEQEIHPSVEKTPAKFKKIVNIEETDQLNEISVGNVTLKIIASKTNIQNSTHANKDHSKIIIKMNQNTNKSDCNQERRWSSKIMKVKAKYVKNLNQKASSKNYDNMELGFLLNTYYKETNVKNIDQIKHAILENVFEQIESKESKEEKLHEVTSNVITQSSLPSSSNDIVTSHVTPQFDNSIEVIRNSSEKLQEETTDNDSFQNKETNSAKLHVNLKNMYRAEIDANIMMLKNKYSKKIAMEEPQQISVMPQNVNSDMLNVSSEFTEEMNDMIQSSEIDKIIAGLDAPNIADDNNSEDLDNEPEHINLDEVATNDMSALLCHEVMENMTSQYIDNNKNPKLSDFTCFSNNEETILNSNSSQSTQIEGMTDYDTLNDTENNSNEEFNRTEHFMDFNAIQITDIVSLNKKIITENVTKTDIDSKTNSDEEQQTDINGQSTNCNVYKSRVNDEFIIERVTSEPFKNNKLDETQNKLALVSNAQINTTANNSIKILGDIDRSVNEKRVQKNNPSQSDEKGSENLNANGTMYTTPLRPEKGETVNHVQVRVYSKPAQKEIFKPQNNSFVESFAKFVVDIKNNAINENIYKMKSTRLGNKPRRKQANCNILNKIEYHKKDDEIMRARPGSPGDYDNNLIYMEHSYAKLVRYRGNKDKSTKEMVIEAGASITKELTKKSKKNPVERHSNEEGDEMPSITKSDDFMRSQNFAKKSQTLEVSVKFESIDASYEENWFKDAMDYERDDNAVENPAEAEPLRGYQCKDDAIYTSYETIYPGNEYEDDYNYQEYVFDSTANVSEVYTNASEISSKPLENYTNASEISSNAPEKYTNISEIMETPNLLVERYSVLVEDISTTSEPNISSINVPASQFESFEQSVNSKNQIMAKRKKIKRCRKLKVGKHKCFDCINTFTTDKALQYHYDRHHSEKAGQYVCEICKYRFKMEETKEFHKLLHYRSFKCRWCAHESLLYSDLREHFQKVHKNSLDPSVKISQHRKKYSLAFCRYTCDVCGSRWLDKISLKTHLNEHEKPENDNHKESIQNYVKSSSDKIYTSNVTPNFVDSSRINHPNIGDELEDATHCLYAEDANEEVMTSTSYEVDENTVEHDILSSVKDKNHSGGEAHEPLKDRVYVQDTNEWEKTLAPKISRIESYASKIDAPKTSETNPDVIRVKCRKEDLAKNIYYIEKESNGAQDLSNKDYRQIAKHFENLVIDTEEKLNNIYYFPKKNDKSRSILKTLAVPIPVQDHTNLSIVFNKDNQKSHKQSYVRDHPNSLLRPVLINNTDRMLQKLIIETKQGNISKEVDYSRDDINYMRNKSNATEVRGQDCQTKLSDIITNRKKNEAGIIPGCGDQSKVNNSFMKMKINRSDVIATKRLTEVKLDKELIDKILHEKDTDKKNYDYQRISPDSGDHFFDFIEAYTEKITDDDLSNDSNDDSDWRIDNYDKTTEDIQMNSAPLDDYENSSDTVTASEFSYSDNPESSLSEDWVVSSYLKTKKESRDEYVSAKRAKKEIKGKNILRQKRSNIPKKNICRKIYNTRRRNTKHNKEMNVASEIIVNMVEKHTDISEKHTDTSENHTNIAGNHTDVITTEEIQINSALLDDYENGSETVTASEFSYSDNPESNLSEDCVVSSNLIIEKESRDEFVSAKRVKKEIKGKTILRRKRSNTPKKNIYTKTYNTRRRNIKQNKEMNVASEIIVNMVEKHIDTSENHTNISENDTKILEIHSDTSENHINILENNTDMPGNHPTASNKQKSKIKPDSTFKQIKNKTILTLIKEMRNSLEFKLAEHKCIDCLQMFNDSSLLSRHNKSHARPGFECEICKCRYPTEWQKQAHVQSHYSYFVCRYCSMEFINYSSMRQHFEKSHTHLLNSGTATYTLRFACDVCNKITCTRKTMEGHKMLHNGCACPTCGKSFTKIKYCKTHMTLKKHWGGSLEPIQGVVKAVGGKRKPRLKACLPSTG